MSAQYEPAHGPDAWTAAVGVAGVALLGPGTPAALVEELWHSVSRGAGLGTVLGILAAGAPDLAQLPPFAVVFDEATGRRVVVRGDVTVTVGADAGADSVDGRGVATWTERVMAADGPVDIAAGGAGGVTGSLPIVEGVVRAARLRLDAGVGAVSAVREPEVEVESAMVPAPVPAPEPEPKPEPEPEPEREATVPDAFPDDTVISDRVARAAAEAPAAAPSEREGDHDGRTISIAEYRALREAALTAPAATVPARSTDDVPARRPVRGRIRVSTGEVVELDRVVIVGRRPRGHASGGELPRLVAVPSPQQDISRSHLEIRAERDHVLVIDLDTTNGTILRRGGSDPVRLHPGEPTMVVTGDVADLGDDITVTFEDLP